MLLRAGQSPDLFNEPRCQGICSPTVSRVSVRAGSQVPLPPAGWLIKSVRTRPAPAAVWLSRGVIDPEVRLPTAVLSQRHSEERH
jgi:hypothetical protein